MSQDLIPITQLILPIPETINQFAWQQSRAYRSIDAQWHVYLNQIAAQVLLSDLQTDFPTATLAPDQSRLWPLVNGTVLQLNQKRLVLIPDKAIDQSELVIPQEWVDSPDCAGDYFLAVRIDPDEELLHCWGYVTHQRLKAKAQYAPDDRTYRLDAHHVIPDMSALWVVQQLNPTEVTQAAIAPLAAVSPAQAENLLQRLVNARIPRLEIPFALWGALITDRAWRDRLVALRQGETSLATEIAAATTQLSGWMQNAFTTGWQAVEDFFGSDAELAFALRQTAAAPAVPTVRRVKALRLPEQLLLLLLTVEPDADGRMGIQVQLRASDRIQLIPADLSLELVSSHGDVVQSVQAREQDNAIQLPRFRSAIGTQFSIQVRWAGMPPEFTFSEAFVV
jgi:Protein of unknown function (DUF1822)